MNNAIFPLACTVAILQAWAAPCHAEEAPFQIKPLMAVHHSDNSADTLYQLGKHHQGEQRLDQAAEAYLAALAQDERHVDARNALAVIYSTQRKFTEALREFQIVLGQRTDLSHVHSNLGYTHFLMENYPAALSELGAAIALDPANSRAFGNLAMVHEKMGGADKARLATLRGAAIQPASAHPAGQTAIDAPPVSASAKAASEGVAVAAMPASPAASPKTKVPAVEPLAQVAQYAPKQDFTLEIANGTPNAHLGAGMSALLSRQGYLVSSNTEIKPYTQRRTVIFYRDGFHKQALALSRSFAVPPAIVNNTHSRNPSDKSDVRLVLGKTAEQAELVAGTTDARAMR